MSLLSGPEIGRLIAYTRARRAAGRDPGVPAIDVNPFEPGHLGPNSLDLTLAGTLLTYRRPNAGPLRADRENPTEEHRIPAGGFLLRPGVLYLGSTVERTECHGLVPVLNGRSSVGRLGVSVHVTAGFGDDGFDGRWTLEITAVEPVVVHAGARICQVAFFTLHGARQPYRGRYQGQHQPTASRMHLGANHEQGV